MKRVAIVGAGIRGRLFARCLRQNGAEIVAVADPNHDRAAELAADFGAGVYPDHQALLAADRIDRVDAVVVATPDPYHREVAVDAANAGKDLLVEKPLATTVDDAEAIRAAVRHAGVRAMVAFENRWNPRFIAARDMVASGELGEVLFQCARLNDTVFVPTEMLGWAAASTPGWFLMPHTVDLALWTRTDRPVSVYASRRDGFLAGAGIDTADGLHAMITFENGGTLVLQSHWVLPAGHPAVFDFRFDITGTSASLSIDGGGEDIRLSTGREHSWVRTGLTESNGRLSGGSVEMARDFLSYLDGEDIDVPDIDTGVEITRIVAAIHDSAATGAVVALTEPTRTG